MVIWYQSNKYLFLSNDLPFLSSFSSEFTGNDLGSHHIIILIFISVSRSESAQISRFIIVPSRSLFLRWENENASQRFANLHQIHRNLVLRFLLPPTIKFLLLVHLRSSPPLRIVLRSLILTAHLLIVLLRYPILQITFTRLIIFIVRIILV